MTSFTLHFILSNLFISLSILIILGTKYLFRNYLSAQTGYRLWAVLFVLMALPFFPIRLSEITPVFSHAVDSETALSARKTRKVPGSYYHQQILPEQNYS